MPDHFHIIINPYDTILSDIIHDIKLSFIGQFRSKFDHYRGQFWQTRFWDHIIRDQDDLNKHIDYIHYNPVKHGLTQNPFNWNMSSIIKFKDDGYYQDDWGVIEELNFEGEFGE
jgi:putative transposase